MFDGGWRWRACGESAQPLVALAFNAQTLDAVLGTFSPTGHYGDGLNLYARAGANPVSRSDALGLDWHHLYPCYLGGNADGPGIWLNQSQHNAFHDMLRDLLGRGSYENQRKVWKSLTRKRRKQYLKLAAEAAGVDVDASEFKSVLDRAYAAAIEHGENIKRGDITKGNHLRVRMRRGPKQLVTSKVPGANSARALAKGAAVAGGVLASAQLLVLLDLENSALRELSRATVRARAGGGLSLWDEAFALYDFYELTGEPISAGYAWTQWSDGL